MQTFLTSSQWNVSPSEIFSATAKTLDNKRLNKQALEAWQILMTNLRLNPDNTLRTSKAWMNHPATRMWTGCDSLLLDYINEMVTEWVARGYKSTIADKAQHTFRHALRIGATPSSPNLPNWITNPLMLESVVNTHRIALSAKEWDHYKQFEWVNAEPASYEYHWIQSGLAKSSLQNWFLNRFAIERNTQYGLTMDSSGMRKEANE